MTPQQIATLVFNGYPVVVSINNQYIEVVGLFKTKEKSFRFICRDQYGIDCQMDLAFHLYYSDEALEKGRNLLKS